MESEPKETSDLLVVYKRPSSRSDIVNIETNGHSSHKEEVPGPPDGGVRAYLVMVGSFLINGLLFGVINSYSVIYDVLKNTDVANAESRASLVGSLTMGTTFLLSPVSGVLTGLLGLRMTAVLGGSIAAAGLLISSFFVNNINVLIFTYGIMYGLGASLAYTPSLAILGHYFKKHLGVVNGIVTIGSSIFTVIMSSLMDHMISNYGLSWMFVILAILTFGIALCGLLFKPTPLMVVQKTSRDLEAKNLLKTIINVEIWKNRRYVLWALSMPIALFGYLVPYVHIRRFVEINFSQITYKNICLHCIAVTSGLGRLIFGFLADKPGIDRILLQQVSFYFIGTFTIILPFVAHFEFLVAISLGMGLFDGAFISLIGPIAFELVGDRYAAQAIGCMLGLAAAPLSIGPPTAAYIFNKTNSYTLPFVLAGISPLVGATIMFAIRFHKKGNADTTKNGHVPISSNGTNSNGNATSSLLASDPERSRKPSL